MALLEKWKAAKKAFETATGRKKPSAKFMGIFGKSSGIESALKKLDAALAKRAPKDVATAKEEYRKTFESYYKTLLKGALAEAGDENYKAELLKLNVALNGILGEADRAQDDLAQVAVEEAVGPAALAALGRCQLLTNASLLGWLSDPSVGLVEVDLDIGLQKMKEPNSVQSHAQAKKCYQEIKKQFSTFTALRSKVLERGKALALAEKFIENVNGFVSGMAGSISVAIGEWAQYQDAAIRKLDPEGAREAIDSWHAKSTAWKHAVKLKPVWDNVADVRNDFRAALRKQGAAGLNK